MSRIFIGMAVYNGEHIVKEAIDSVLNQSYRDFTLFISDDASTDSSPEICQDYARKDSRVVYYRQEKNLGIMPNLKFMLDRADEELFTLVDADDLRGKDFLRVCVEAIERKNVDAAITVVSVVDSYGRSMREQNELTEFSGEPNLGRVVRFVMQPEVLGKCNFMYCVFKTEVARKLWEISPQSITEWGADNHYSLALISRYKVYVDPQPLLMKRIGGVSSLDATKRDVPEKVRRHVIKNPKSFIFPFEEFGSYFRGELHAVQHTPYQIIVAVLLLIRLPRAFYIYLRKKLSGFR